MNNNILETIGLLDNVQQQLLNEYGRKATPEEIAEEMETETTVILSLMKLHNRITALMESIDISLNTAQFFSNLMDKSVGIKEKRAMNHRLHMELDEYDRLNLLLENLTN